MRTRFFGYRAASAIAAILLLAIVAAYVLATVLQSPSCGFDPFVEYSEVAMMLAFPVGAAMLLFAAWRFTWRRAVAGLALPAVGCAAFAIALAAGRSLQLECKEQPLPQALARCGERLDRYDSARTEDTLILTLKPGQPTDNRFVCLARWADWHTGVDVLSAPGK